MRFRDIIRYYNGKRDFIFQNTISRAFSHNLESYDSSQGNNAFISLIKSYENAGYDENSIISVDREIRLVDGTHRMALNLYFQVPYINCRIIKRRNWWRRDISWYEENSLGQPFIDQVLNVYHEIEKELVSRGDCFCIQAQNVSNSFMDFLNKNATLFGINWIDTDMGWLIRFSIAAPEYKLKNGTYVSNRAEVLYSQFTSLFPDVVIVKHSMNCLEGRQLYETLKDRLLEE